MEAMSMSRREKALLAALWALFAFAILSPWGLRGGTTTLLLFAFIVAVPSFIWGLGKMRSARELLLVLCMLAGAGATAAIGLWYIRTR